MNSKLNNIFKVGSFFLLLLMARYDVLGQGIFYTYDKSHTKLESYVGQYTTINESIELGTFNGKPKYYIYPNKSLSFSHLTSPDWSGDCTDDYAIAAPCYQGFKDYDGYRTLEGNDLGFYFNVGDQCLGNNRIRFAHYGYHRTYDFLGFPSGCDCDNSCQPYTNDYDFCVVAPAGSVLGTFKSKFGGTNIMIQDLSVPLANAFIWRAPANYCLETVNNIQTRLVSFNGVPVSASEQEWNAWQGLIPPGAFSDQLEKASGSFQFTKGYGQYVIGLRVRDRYNNIFEEAQISFCIIPPCSFDTTPTVSVVDEQNQNVSILGGYSNGSTVGGYELVSGQLYTLSLYNGTQISDFDGYYTVQAKDGNGDTPAAVELTKKSTGVYTLKVNSTLGAYTINISNDPSIIGPFGTSCSYTCQKYSNPINILVGNENVNTSVTSDCVVHLPADFESLFGFLPIGFNLNNFTYTVSSKKAIILQPGQTTMRLTAGAHLLLNVENEDVAEIEKIDNDKNWTKKWVYDESGNIIAEQKSFFDKAGNPTQQQVKELSAGVVMCSQVVKDRYGRPALQTLQAPVRTKMSTTGVDDCGDPILPESDLFFIYEPKFITKNNISFNYSNFDLYQNADGSYTDKISNPSDAPDVLTPGTLGWYYSANNTLSYSGLTSIPNGTLLVEDGVPISSWPYSRTLYKTDGTGLAKSVTSPGDQHHSATGHYDQSSILPIVSSDPNYVNDEIIIADYLNLYTSVFSVAPNPRNKWKIFKSVSDEMTYTDISGTTQPGNRNILYVDGDGKTLIALHVSSGNRSFSYYDALSRVVCNVTPKGVEQWKAGIAFTEIDKTKTIYNSRGLVIETVEKDAGHTRYMYRKDGMLRYTQNSKQAITSTAEPLGRFSYIHYDQVDRVVETGEFIPSGSSGLIFNSSLLKKTLEYEEIVQNNSDLQNGGARLDVSSINYDLPVLADQNFTSGRVSKLKKDNGTSTYFNYDDRGRIIWTQQDIPDLGSKIIAYKYASNGQVKEVAFQPDNSAESFYHYYKYDLDNRLLEARVGRQAPVYSNTDLDQLDNSTPVLKTVAQYDYFLHGPLKSVKLGPEELNYVYTIQGWLKSINGDRMKASTAKGFAMTLDYFNGDYTNTNGTIVGNTSTLPAVAKYNGLINAQTWRTEKPSGAAIPDETYAYRYTYDNLDQLTNAIWGKVNNTVFQPQGNTFKEGQLSYDANGNIQTLARYNNSGGLLSDFTGTNGFVYEESSPTYPKGLSNKLSTVPGYASYSYNEIGQLTSQTLLATNTNRTFTYTGSGLTNTISANNLPLINYSYDAFSEPYKKDKYSNSGQLASSNYYVHDGLGNVVAIYQKGSFDTEPALIEYNIYGSDRIGQYRKEANAFAYVYELKDHVGSIRALLWQNENSSTGDLYSYSDYYPFGLRFPNYNDLTYKFGYQGAYAEFDVETGLNHFELRDYDPVVGRWLGPDPYQEFYSAYVGMGNNPVSLIDPSGGYSELGALWRSVWYGGQLHFDETRGTNGEWGYGKMTDDGAFTVDYGGKRGSDALPASTVPWMDQAKSQLGQKEMSPGDNSVIIGYHATTGGFKTDETAWCSSFANWCYKKSNIRGTNSASALSWNKWGQTLKKPGYGSLAVIDYGKGKGHVGFVAGVNSKGKIILLGGNQKDMVKYSAFSKSMISKYVYPENYTPSYNLPVLDINGNTSFSSTR